MSDARTVAPGSSRFDRAWRAGLRPGSRWVSFVGLSLVWLAYLDDGPRDVTSFAHVLRFAMARAQGPDVSVLRELVDAALSAGAVILVIAFSVALLAAWLRGDLGPVDRRLRRSLRLRPSSPGVVVPLVLAVLTVILSWFAVREVIAGAARGVDAELDGLAHLYLAWTSRTVWTAALVGTVVGSLEWIWQVRRRRWLLHQSVAEARNEQRELGARLR